MTFSESISACFIKYAAFDGRASRPEYWWFVLFVCLVWAGLGIINDVLSGLFLLGVLAPTLAVGARRLHDTNRSGWLQLIALIPFVGVIILIVFLASAPVEPNKYSPEPPAA